jgi:hypothetical protein
VVTPVARREAVAHARAAFDISECRFRRNPDRYSDLKPDSIPE